MATDTEARLCEYIGFVVKYFPDVEFNSISLVDCIGSPAWLTFYFSFQLARRLSPATMKTFQQALDKAVHWAVERVRYCPCTLAADPAM